MPELFAVSWDWITRNLEIVLPVVLFLIFNVLSRLKSDEPEAPRPDRRPMQDPSRTEPSDGLTPEQRAEKIREEIRRRIQERMGGGPVLPPETPQVEQEEAEPEISWNSEEPSWNREEPTWNRPETAAAPPPLPAQVPAARRPEPVAEPVAALKETGAASHGLESFSDQFRRLEEARKKAADTAIFIKHLGSGIQPAAAVTTREISSGIDGRRAPSLRAELRDREGARRALVLKEILDTPVSLRRH